MQSLKATLLKHLLFTVGIVVLGGYADHSNGLTSSNLTLQARQDYTLPAGHDSVRLFHNNGTIWLVASPASNARVLKAADTYQVTQLLLNHSFNGEGTDSYLTVIELARRDGSATDFSLRLITYSPADGRTAIDFLNKVFTVSGHWSTVDGSSEANIPPPPGTIDTYVGTGRGEVYNAHTSVCDRDLRSSECYATCKANFNHLMSNPYGQGYFYGSNFVSKCMALPGEQHLSVRYTSKPGPVYVYDRPGNGYTIYGCDVETVIIDCI